MRKQFNYFLKRATGEHRLPLMVCTKKTIAINLLNLCLHIVINQVIKPLKTRFYNSPKRSAILPADGWPQPH